MTTNNLGDAIDGIGEGTDIIPPQGGGGGGGCFSRETKSRFRYGVGDWRGGFELPATKAFPQLPGLTAGDSYPFGNVAFSPTR